MISLEHDPDMLKRAEFNCPYKFIEVQGVNAGAFLATDQSAKPSIYWFDYDGGIGQDIIRDISGVATKLQIGDFCFITVYGGPPRVVDAITSRDRLVWLQDNFADFAGDVTAEDAEKSNFVTAVHKILLAAFRNAFAPRRDGRFFPFLQIEYSDSLPMITVGGALLADGQITAMKGKIQSSLPFLTPNAPELYEIKSLHLTERERGLFDRAATAVRKNNSDRNKLLEIGFRDAELSAYQDILRYFPRYVETIV